jgi:2-dehydropantoate 2-reductase
MAPAHHDEGQPVRIVVLGAGALGSIIGAHLAHAGEDVVFVARGQRAAVLQHHGIVVTGLSDFAVPATVATHPHEVKEADVLLVTVKTYDTEAALASLRHLRAHSVLSVQNGVLKNEQLAGIFGWERVLGAAAVVAGEIQPDGAVRYTLNERLALGELPEGTSERARGLAATLARAGLRAEVSSHIRTVEWSKYALFVGGMALASLTRLPTAKFLNDPDGALLMARLVRELGHLATRLGIPLEDAPPLPIRTLCSGSLAEAVEQARRFGAVMAKRAPTHKVSTLQDLERGRRLEVEETLGYAVRKAAELDVPLPTVETCYRLLAGINRHVPGKEPTTRVRDAQA